MRKVLGLIVLVSILVILAAVLSQYWPARIAEEQRGELETDTEEIAEIPENGATQTGVGRVVVPRLGLRIEPQLYLSYYDPNTGQGDMKAGRPPVTEIPVGKRFIFHLDISGIDASESHVLRTVSYNAADGDYDPGPDGWGLWGAVCYEEEIMPGNSEYQVDIVPMAIGMAGWWEGKKKVEIYWDDQLVDTFYFNTVPRKD